MPSVARARARALDQPHVLIGGLGMGFTLRAALDLLSRDAVVVVAELLPAVVEWNRGPLGPLANHPLDDPRVTVAPGDVAVTVRTSRAGFDAILLDVDNGPDAFTSQGNARLYDDGGLSAAARRAPSEIVEGAAGRCGRPGRIENSSSGCATRAST